MTILTLDKADFRTGLFSMTDIHYIMMNMLILQEGITTLYA